eukprot:862555-Rhodomonas_salina.1
MREGRCMLACSRCSPTSTLWPSTSSISRSEKQRSGKNFFSSKRCATRDSAESARQSGPSNRLSTDGQEGWSWPPVGLGFRV